MKHKTKSIHQIDVALIQLERACELFFRKDFISALTLAGAADEILGGISDNETKKLLGRKKKDRGISAITLNAGMMEFSGVSFGTFKQERNKIRNEFKHLTENYLVEISEVENKARQFIADGATNYKFINGTLPTLPLIKKFCAEVGVS